MRPALAAGALVELEHVDRGFRSRPALVDVNLRLDRGRVLGVVGGNGAGKTTLLRVLAGSLQPSGGTIRALPGLRTGFAPDSDVVLYGDITVAGYLALMHGLGGGGTPGPGDVVELFSLQGLATTEIRTLSRGYRQRVLLAQAVLGGPGLLLLDEPLNALDPFSSEQVGDLLRRLPWEPGIVVSSHHLPDLLDFADEIAVLSAGSIIALGPPATFLSSPGGAVSIAVLAGEEAVRRALAGPFRLDELSSRGGTTRALVMAAAPGEGEGEVLARDVLGHLVAGGIPVADVTVRRLSLPGAP